MKIGDTIKCRDKDDMVDTMLDLAKVGIETDFVYETDGVKLVVTKITPKEPKADGTDTDVLTKQEPRWIPVSERLPEMCEEDVDGNITISKAVLSCRKYGNDGRCGKGYIVGIDRYTTNNNGFWFSEVPFGVPDDCKVIAWMPLPKPYKEDINE